MSCCCSCSCSRSVSASVSVSVGVSVGVSLSVHFSHIWSSKVVWDPRFLHFSLRNVLRATTVCNFPSQLPEVVRRWSVFGILTSKSRHSCVPFLISHLARWLRRFSEPTFQSGGKTLEKTLCFATFLHFRAPASSFFWLFLFSELVSSAFLFSDSCHLSFSICPYCRKFWPLNFLRYIYIYISPEKLPSCSPADLHLRIHVISSIHDEFHLVDWHPRKSHGHRFSARRPTSKPRGRPYDNPQEIEAVTSHQMLLHKRIKDHASDQLCLKPRETS